MKDDTFSIVLLVGVVLVVLFLRSKQAGTPLLSLFGRTPPAPPAAAAGWAGQPLPPGTGTNYLTPPQALTSPPAPPYATPGSAPTGAATGVKSTFFGTTVDVSAGTIDSLSSLYNELKSGAIATGCEVSGGGCLSSRDIQTAAKYDLQQDAVQAAYGRGYGH